nr:MAG TPA: hypothetical protein [Caudoviricetes sp.]
MPGLPLFCLNKRFYGLVAVHPKLWAQRWDL